MIDLPFRLRALRRQRGLSLEQLAQQTGLTKSYLSKLERGVSEPSISTVLRLSEAYETSVAQLIGTGQDGLDESISVVRADEREPLVRTGVEFGYRYQAMAGKRKVKSMEPFIVHPPRELPVEQTVFPHAGEEFMLVLKGAVEVVVGEKQFTLKTGDSLYFDAELPHSMRTVGRINAEVLVVASK